MPGLGDRQRLKSECNLRTLQGSERPSPLAGAERALLVSSPGRQAGSLTHSRLHAGTSIYFLLCPTAGPAHVTEYRRASQLCPSAIGSEVTSCWVVKQKARTEVAVTVARTHFVLHCGHRKIPQQHFSEEQEKDCFSAFGHLFPQPLSCRIMCQFSACLLPLHPTQEAAL